MKLLSSTVYMGVFLAAVAAPIGGAGPFIGSASAAQTDEIDGAPSCVQSHYGEGSFFVGVSGVLRMNKKRI